MNENSDYLYRGENLRNKMKSQILPEAVRFQKDICGYSDEHEIDRIDSIRIEGAVPDEEFECGFCLSYTADAGKCHIECSFITTADGSAKGGMQKALDSCGLQDVSICYSELYTPGESQEDKPGAGIWKIRADVKVNSRHLYGSFHAAFRKVYSAAKVCCFVFECQRLGEEPDLTKIQVKDHAVFTPDSYPEDDNYWQQRRRILDACHFEESAEEHLTAVRKAFRYTDYDIRGAEIEIRRLKAERPSVTIDCSVWLEDDSVSLDPDDFSFRQSFRIDNYDRIYRCILHGDDVIAKITNKNEFYLIEPLDVYFYRPDKYHCIEKRYENLIAAKEPDGTYSFYFEYEYDEDDWRYPDDWENNHSKIAWTELVSDGTSDQKRVLRVAYDMRLLAPLIASVDEWAFTPSEEDLMPPLKEETRKKYDSFFILNRNMRKAVSILKKWLEKSEKYPNFIYIDPEYHSRRSRDEEVLDFISDPAARVLVFLRENRRDLYAAYQEGSDAELLEEIRFVQDVKNRCYGLDSDQGLTEINRRANLKDQVTLEVFQRKKLFADRNDKLIGSDDSVTVNGLSAKRNKGTYLRALIDDIEKKRSAKYKDIDPAIPVALRMFGDGDDERAAEMLGKSAEDLEQQAERLRRPKVKKEKNEKKLADILVLLGELYHVLDNEGKCEACLNEAESILSGLTLQTEEEQYRFDLAHVYNQLGDLYARFGKTSAALYSYGDSLAIYRRFAAGEDSSELEQVTAMVCHNTAAYYAHIGKPAEAEPLYLEAVRRMEKALTAAPEDTEADLAVFCNSLADFYADENRPDEALPYFDKAMEISHRLADQNRFVSFGEDLAMTCNKLAEICLKNDGTDKAEEICRQNMDFFARLTDNTDYDGNAHGLAIIYNRLALVLKKQKSFEEAAFWCQESADLYSELTEESPELYDFESAMNYTDLAEIYEEQNEFAKAEEAYLEAIRILEWLAAEDTWYEDYLAAYYVRLLDAMESWSHQQLSYDQWYDITDRRDHYWYKALQLYYKLQAEELGMTVERVKWMWKTGAWADGPNSRYESIIYYLR